MFDRFATFFRKKLDEEDPWLMAIVSWIIIVGGFVTGNVLYYSILTALGY